MTNQITTQVSRDLMKRSDWLTDGGGGEEDQGVVTAALGNAWFHCVNTRLLLEYLHGGKRLVSGCVYQCTLGLLVVCWLLRVLYCLRQNLYFEVCDYGFNYNSV